MRIFYKLLLLVAATFETAAAARLPQRTAIKPNLGKLAVIGQLAAAFLAYQQLLPLPAAALMFGDSFPSTLLSRILDDDTFLSPDIFSDLEDAFQVTSALQLPKRIAIDITETQKGYQVNADIPGVQKRDIKLNVIQNNVLKISLEKESQASSNADKDTLRYSERRRGFVSRSISLPDDADTKRIEAKYNNGVLTIDIAKLPEEAAPRTEFSIEIK